MIPVIKSIGIKQVFKSIKTYQKNPENVGLNGIYMISNRIVSSIKYLYRLKNIQRA